MALEKPEVEYVGVSSLKSGDVVRLLSSVGAFNDMMVRVVRKDGMVVCDRPYLSRPDFAYSEDQRVIILTGHEEVLLQPSGMVQLLERSNVK